MEVTPPKRPRGRPPGSPNRPKFRRPVDPTDETPGAYLHADPETLIARQFAMVEWAQDSLRANALKDGSVDAVSMEKVTNSLVRAIDALRRYSQMADALSERMTAEQLLEAAVKKVEAQDAASIRYTIKRLRAHLERIGAQPDSQALRDAGATALDAINSLGDE